MAQPHAEYSSRELFFHWHTLFTFIKTNVLLLNYTTPAPHSNDKG